ncbi:uncharacterized protein F5147DRAFT_569971 [Suillus discolor]|uniref:Uncharacterized protein n=1 Tax=Suillus discolor TaxID=1912936 RepID=A0A9P7JXM4_9AGAM|nr:uncharacterized protein F5147DRAFT_569971 [Suillus discolor]KAG2114583.1 hypothetical protein F5147DRAFT_569971 [Suillus discolor]
MPEPASDKLHIVMLRDGTVLELADAEIPDPPAISFVNNISWLNSMWDDCMVHWQGESVMNIQGHLIALEYWPLLYHYGCDHQWKSMKSKWTDWRYVVECYREGTEAQFWEEFSADGKCMSYTVIIQKLCAKRKMVLTAAVEHACKEYGDEFNDLFTYWKGREEHVMVKPSVVAKRFNQLAGGHVHGCRCSTRAHARLVFTDFPIHVQCLSLSDVTHTT